MAQLQRSESQSAGRTDYEHLEISDTLKQLGVDPKSGLSDAEAKESAAEVWAKRTGGKEGQRFRDVRQVLLGIDISLACPMLAK